MQSIVVFANKAGLYACKCRGNCSAGTVRTPRAISAKMQPMLQMSTGSAYRFVPSSTSGARYQSVTTCTHCILLLVLQLRSM